MIWVDPIGPLPGIMGRPNGCTPQLISCRLLSKVVVCGEAMGRHFTEREMVRRPGDKAPEPPGGRAAERLRMFEQARQPSGATQGKKTKVSSKRPKKRGPQGMGAPSNAEQTRGKDRTKRA